MTVVVMPQDPSAVEWNKAYLLNLGKNKSVNDDEDRDVDEGEEASQPMFSRINQYEAIERICQGTMGDIFRVRDSSKSEPGCKDQEYALKIFTEDAMNLKAARSGGLNKDLLAASIDHLTRLSHPNVIAIKEIIEDSFSPKSIFVVCDYADAGPIMAISFDHSEEDRYYAIPTPSFSAVDSGSPFTDQSAGNIFCQIIDAFGHLHQNHVAHRNIHLENILMTREGQVKLTGFEYSHDYSNEINNEGNYGLTVDTPGVWPMWSPEICLSSVSGASYSAFKADVWAVGVLLYMMIFGKFPFYDSDPGGLFDKIIATTQCSTPLKFPSEISPSLAQLFEQLFDSNPGQRPTFLQCRGCEWLDGIINKYANEKLEQPYPRPTLSNPSLGQAKYRTETSTDMTKKQMAKEAKRETKIKERKIKHNLHDANGHKWYPKYFNKPTWCRICDDFVFGLTMDMQKSYKCRECKMAGHLKCVRNYNEHVVCTKGSSADRQKVLPKISHAYNPAPVPNVGGHVWRKKYLKSPTWCKVCNTFIFGVTTEQQNAYKCLLCKTIGHRNCCEYYNEHGCSIGRFGSEIISNSSVKKEKVAKITRSQSGDVTGNETLAMINQYEVTQEFGDSIVDKSHLTVVIDTTDPERCAYVMRSFPGEKLKVPPFYLRRKGTFISSDANKIHLEIELMRKMVHPNLQLIRDVISETVTPNNVHMVLELVDGGQILNSKPNSDEELSPIFYVPGTDGVYAEGMASVIFRQLLSALVYLQRNHIAHRDLKPENILITKKGVVKLTEFGSSIDFKKVADEEGCESGLVSDTKGSWPFWAPEICDDSVDDLLYSAYIADVWAAGVVLHTMLIGTLPFWDVNPDKLFKMILETRTVELKPCYPEGISPEYRELLEAMLSPDPSLRPSFEVCESFDWIQNQSNEENEIKLNEASSILIEQKACSFSYTPGNAFYLADDTEGNADDVSADSATRRLYKNKSSNEYNDDPSDKLTPEEQKAKSLPPEDVNGHEWKPKYLNKPTFCKICNSFVWGLTEEQQGAYKCKSCKTVGHRHCCRLWSESSECVPVVAKVNTIGLDSLSTFQKKSLHKMLAKSERHWDMLRGATKSSGFSEVVVDAVKSGLHPPPNVNGHVWRSKYLTKPTWCKVCDAFIFGVTKEQQNAYKCFLCKMSAHRDCCIKHNETPCTGGRKSEKKLETESEESKEKLAMINQYEVLKELGRGAYGKVYLITDSTSTDRAQYAMKTFPGSKMKTKKLGRFAPKGPSEADKIRFEIKIMKAMSHPNIVALAECIEESVAPHNVHLVLELVDGGQILDSKPNESEELSPIFYVPGTGGVYEEKIASVIFRQLLSALVYLERNHIAHRDLKPENVLITKKGVVKLTDFGVSSDFSVAETEDERKGMISDTAGTWPFWAPEMCDESVEDGSKFSAYMADVWAAGVILYTMMIGQLPFWNVEPDSLFELIVSTQTTKLKPPYPTGISTAYCELLEAMLTPNPTIRPSFEACERFEWLQQHSNAENENKLNECSSTLIDRENFSKELEFTPGNSYFLVADDNNTTGSFYKNSSGKLGNLENEKSSSSSDVEHHKGKEPPKNVNGHDWNRTYLNKPTWCKICDSFVWGLTAEQQGAYKCKNCKTFGHRHCCIKLNNSVCHVPNSGPSSSSEHDSDTVAQTLTDLNGHMWHAKNVKSPRWCEICEAFIYKANDIEQYAFKCSNCKVVGHKECCIKRNNDECVSKDGLTPLKKRLSSFNKSKGDEVTSKEDEVRDSDKSGQTPKKTSLGSGLMQRLSLVTKSASKEKKTKDNKDKSI